MYQLLKEYLSKNMSIKDEHLSSLSTVLHPKTTKRNEILLEAGSICRYMYFVNKGCLRIYLMDEGGRESTRFLVPEGRFVPLGIKSFYWYKFPGSNECAAASGLRLRSRDILKFGVLYQQNGMWQDKQIVPGAWVKQSFDKQITISPNLGYGYLFWKIYPPDAYKNIPELTVCVGNGDERIFLDDKNKMIVVVTAGN